MHESEAMDFIAAVLRGFMERIFKIPFSAETKHIYLPLFAKIRSYIDDENGYWVKEKAIDVIHCIEDLETKIVNNDYKPQSAESFIENVLVLAEELMQERIDIYRTEKDKDPKRLHDFFPLPFFPARKDQ